MYKVILRWLFHDRGHYHIEIRPLILRANQWTGFYMIGTSVMQELIHYGKELTKKKWICFFFVFFLALLLQYGLA